MNIPQQRRRPGRRWVLALALAATGTGAGLALADEIVVRAKAVDIRAGRGSMFPVVATLKSGDRLQVEERQGKWLRVSVGGKEGFVVETALAAAGGSGLGALSQGANTLAGNAQASEVGASAAARGIGVDPVAAQYASSQGMSTAGIEQMLANRNRVVNSGQWLKFTQQGKVGPSAGSGGDDGRGGAQ